LSISPAGKHSSTFITSSSPEWRMSSICISVSDMLCFLSLVSFYFYLLLDNSFFLFRFWALQQRRHCFSSSPAGKTLNHLKFLLFVGRLLSVALWLIWLLLCAVVVIYWPVNWIPLYSVYTSHRVVVVVVVVVIAIV
jgi:hypothetical protein